jgi:superfamily II DNA/RNA helicase
VINYQCPEDEKIYLHRIGRTGRAGERGVAVTFVDWDDLARWRMVNEALKLPFPDPPETYSTSDHLFEALDIPRDVKGMLPRDQRVRAGLAAEQVEDLGETGRRNKPRITSRGKSGGAERPAAKRAPGSRVRTRGGAATASSPDNGEAGDTGAHEHSVPEAVATASAPGSQDGQRRRRRRRGRGHGGGVSDTNGDNQGVAEAS